MKKCHGAGLLVGGEQGAYRAQQRSDLFFWDPQLPSQSRRAVLATGERELFQECAELRRVRGGAEGVINQPLDCVVQAGRQRCAALRGVRRKPKNEWISVRHRDNGSDGVVPRGPERARHHGVVLRYQRIIGRTVTFGSTVATLIAG
jgi:hypothetical protein